MEENVSKIRKSMKRRKEGMCQTFGSQWREGRREMCQRFGSQWREKRKEMCQRFGSQWNEGRISECVSGQAEKDHQKGFLELLELIMPLTFGLWTTSYSVLIVIRKNLSWAFLLSNQHLFFSKEEHFKYRIVQHSLLTQI